MALFDESKVVAGHEGLATSISGSMKTLHASAQLIRIVLNRRLKGDELTVGMLGFRIINDVGAATRLLDNGYFIQSAALLRDLSEVAALALFFATNTKKINEWKNLEGRDRYNKFGFSKLESSIEPDKYTYLKRFFGDFSELGTHPSFKSFNLHNDNGIIQNGPHINPVFYIAIHKELAQLVWHVTDAAGECWTALTSEEIASRFPKEQQAFVEAFGAWEKDANP